MIRGVVELMEDGGEEGLVVCCSKKKKNAVFLFDSVYQDQGPLSITNTVCVRNRDRLRCFLGC